MRRALPLVFVVALAACGGGGGGPPAQQILSQSAAKTSQAKSFHILVAIDNVPASPRGISLTYLDGDLAVPGALKAKVSGTISGVPVSSQLVIVGGKTYLKNPLTGAWQSVSVGASPVEFFDPAKGVLAVIRSATGVSKAGSDTVGDVATYRLKAKVRADALTPLLGNPPGARRLPVELWVGKDDHLLRRVDLSGPIAKGEPPNALRTVQLSRFGEPVHVTAPAVP